MGDTRIEWSDYTVNPFPGCRKVSEGCRNCFAERMAKRLKAIGQTKYAACVDGNGWTGEIGYNPFCMSVPGTGKLVFVNSMGDLFYEKIDGPYIRDVFTAIRKQPEHTFQVLTKRPERAVQYFAAYKDDPPANVWLGVTAENQEWADTRIPILLQIPAAVRWVSLEPLLGPVDLTRVNVNHLPGCRGCVANVLDSRDGPLGEPYKHLNWVVCGAETGPGRRWCDTRWVESVVRQCHAAKVPVFVKKLHKPGPGKLPKIVDDINEISNMLGYSPEQLRQWPGKEQP